MGMDDFDDGYSSRRRLKDTDKSRERSRSKSRKSSKRSKSRGYSNMDQDLEDSGESEATQIDAPQIRSKVIASS